MLRAGNPYLHSLPEWIGQRRPKLFTYRQNGLPKQSKVRKITQEVSAVPNGTREVTGELSETRVSDSGGVKWNIVHPQYGRHIHRTASYALVDVGRGAFFKS